MSRIIYLPIPAIFTSEIQVQLYYVRLLDQIIEAEFLTRFKTDGILENKKKNIKMLAEFKLGGNLNNDAFLIKCLSQILAYIKLFEKNGESLPNIIFIANEDRFCIFESSILKEALNLNINWFQYSPSQFFLNSSIELKKYLEDNIKHYNLFSFSIGKLSFIQNIINNFSNKQINLNSGLKLSIDSDNIVNIYEDFMTTGIFKRKLSEHQSIHYFTSIVFNECRTVVEDSNIILFPESDKYISVLVNRPKFDSFVSSIKHIEKPKTKNDIISQQDRLINIIYRKYKGEYYTPQDLVDLAYKRIENNKPNWRETHIVWDPCCGTGNLTRRKDFKYLFCSTIEESDIHIMNQRHVNDESLKFQYDFLNDDVYMDGILTIDRKKIPIELDNLLKTNPNIIFFMNPPFGSPKGGKRSKGTKNSKISTKGMTKTKVRDVMHFNKLGQSSTELTIQFLYKIMLLKKQYKLTNVTIATFSSGSYLTRELYKPFRNVFLNEFNHIDGYMVNSNLFSGVSGGWTVLFNIWTSIPSTDKNNFKISVVGSEICNEKNIYNTDNSTHLVNWLRQNCGKSAKLGHSLSIGQTVGESKICSAILNQKEDYQGNLEIEESNFYDMVVSFTACNVVNKNYLNELDYYLPPNQNKDFDQWKFDSLIYTLFSSSNRSMSMSSNNINNFFWLSIDNIKQLSNDFGFDEMYQKISIEDQERYVFNLLDQDQLSSDAKIVLNKATELTIKSFEKRKELHQLHPEYHLNAWDAGWYQIKKILEKYYKDDLKEFIDLYKKFEDRMREGVYKFGFLK